MIRICAFKHCSNSTYTLSRWSRLTVLKYRRRRTDDACQCPPSFTIDTFSTEKRELAVRFKGTKSVYRKRTNGINWLPSADERICYIYFINGKLTASHRYLTQSLGVNVAPQFYRKSPKLSSEPAQHNIDRLKLVEDVGPMPGNDEQPQHNERSYVFTCNCSPACQCVGCSSRQARLKKTYIMNMMNLRKLSLCPRRRFGPTINKQTLLRDFWPMIRIINTWVKMLAATLRPLIFWPSKQVIRQHVQKAVENYQHLRCTISCTKMFIERPHYLVPREWSD